MGAHIPLPKFNKRMILDFPSLLYVYIYSILSCVVCWILGKQTLRWRLAQRSLLESALVVKTFVREENETGLGRKRR